jgi:hypothetical protein
MTSALAAPVSATSKVPIKNMPVVRFMPASAIEVPAVSLVLPLE